MFSMPFLVSGKCNRIKYLISIILINVAEVVIVISMFSKFQHFIPANLWNIYNDITWFEILFFAIFIYNNIITVKRCKTVGLKKYNYIIPGLQLLKLICYIIFIFILIDKLDMAGYISFKDSSTIWIPLVSLITITNSLQIVYLYKDEKNYNKIKYLKSDKIIKSVIECIIIIEMITAVFTIIIFGNYDRFWKISNYVFIWFWVDGLVGIVLFVFGVCYLDKIKLEKGYIKFLIIPIVSSFLGFIGVVMQIINPRYGSGLEIIKALCHIIGFPLIIIASLQDRYKIKKILIGLIVILIPLARFIVAFNIVIR